MPFYDVNLGWSHQFCKKKKRERELVRERERERERRKKIRREEGERDCQK